MSSFQAAGDFTLSEGVGKRLMTPGGAIAPGVAPELMPVLVLENDRPENLLLMSQRIFGRALSTVGAGGAATRSSLTLLNARPDLLVTIERISCASAYQVQLARYQSNVLPFGSQTNGLPRDTRIFLGTGIPIGTSSSAVIITDNTLGAIGGASVFFGSAGEVFDVPLVLGPFDALYIAATADNTAITSPSVQWRERRLNQSERV